MDKIEIRKTIAFVVIKLVALQLIFSVIYLATSITSDVIDEFNNGTFMNLVTNDTLTFIIIAVVQLILTLYILLEWVMEKYVLHPDKVTHEWGILFRKSDSWKITNVETAHVEESAMGRILNYGTVTLHSPTLESHIVLRDVPSPYLIVTAVEKKLSLMGKAPIKHIRALP